jgi:hypothetical protein
MVGIPDGLGLQARGAGATLYMNHELALPSETGFDRPIYFANEETDPEESFDGRGG